MVPGGCDNLVGGVPSPQSSSRGRGECGKKSPFGSLLLSCTLALAAFVFHPACLNQWRESHVATIGQAISHVGANGGFDGDASSRGGNRCSRGGALRVGVGGGRAAGVHQSRCETSGGGAEVRSLHGGPGSDRRVAEGLRREDGGDGIDGGILDSSVRSSRYPGLRGLVGGSASDQARAGSAEE